LFERPEVDAVVAGMASAGIEERGAVFTRREVVDFILDLAGYTADKPLHRARLLEPSMGAGRFSDAVD
jgi:type I restriction-modification system DNA methylase subunit